MAIWTGKKLGIFIDDDMHMVLHKRKLLSSPQYETYRFPLQELTLPINFSNKLFPLVTSVVLADKHTIVDDYEIPADLTKAELAGLAAKRTSSLVSEPSRFMPSFYSYWKGQQRFCHLELCSRKLVDFLMSLAKEYNWQISTIEPQQQVEHRFKLLHENDSKFIEMGYNLAFTALK